MPARQIHSCCDKLILQRLLSEQLAGEEEAIALAHIEQCNNCRNFMAQLSGSGDLELEIEQHLADHGVDDTGLETVIDSNLIEAEIDHIQAMLGPTDDPHMMGRLGSYEIMALIGRGSTGIVFKALDRGLNRFVAIKMLMPCFAGNASARERFAREGRSIASVRDQHVVQVFAVSEHKGIPFIVMEYLPAGSLAQRITKEGPLQTIEVARIGMQIATALAAAHKQGIVHRDVKPANVLLANGTNRALVTDFGLARLLDEASMTHSGAISGTPQFMSPEQAQGAMIDHRSDLFSLGSVLYSACTAQSAFRSETVFGVIKKVCESEPRPIPEINQQIAPWMCDLIEKLHQKNPQNRFQSAAEVAEHLAAEVAYAQAPSTTSQPVRAWQVPAAREAIGKMMQKSLPVAIGTVTFGMVGLMILGVVDSPEANLDRNTQQVVNPKTESASSLIDDADTSPNLNVTYSSFGRHSTFDEAETYFSSGQYQDAIDHFQVAAQQPELEGIAQYRIGCSLAYLEENEAAIAALRQAIEAGFVDEQHYLYDRDLDQLRNTQPFHELLTLLSPRAEVQTLLADAKTYWVCEDYAEAEERYREILTVAPKCEDAVLNLSLMLHFQRKLDDALPWHQRTARGECYSHLGYYNIACYHALKNEPDQAFCFLRKAFDAGYKDVAHLEADSDLDSIRDDPRYPLLIDFAKEQACQQLAECNDSQIECG
ncbi:MAG: serine/threonine-protein kinase [Fuerstiella sp.]